MYICNQKTKVKILTLKFNIMKTQYFISDNNFSYALTEKSLRWRFLTKKGIKEGNTNKEIDKMLNYIKKTKGNFKTCTYFDFLTLKTEYYEKL